MKAQEIKATEKWNSLTDQQKAAFGDRFITHDTNLKAWAKEFKDLSELKKSRVLSNILNTPTESLNFVKGFGI